MTEGPVEPAEAKVRDLRSEDLGEVVRIDALHTGREKTVHWAGMFRRFVGWPPGKRVGLAVADDGRLAGYLLGEVRAFEFGAGECGWVFAVGVDPGRLRDGVGTLLLEEAARRFRSTGVKRVRTMVRGTEDSMYSFFRAGGFGGGSFIQLELDLEGES